MATTLLRSLRRGSEAPLQPAALPEPATANDVNAAVTPKRWGSLPNLLLTPKRSTTKAKRTKEEHSRSPVASPVEESSAGQAETGTPPATNSPASISSRTRPASLAHRARGSVKSALLGVRAALTLNKYAKHNDEAIDEEGCGSPPPPRIEVPLDGEHEEATGGGGSSLADACLIAPAAPEMAVGERMAVPYPGYHGGSMRRSDSALATTTITSPMASHALAPPLDETGDDVTPLTSPKMRTLLPRSTSHPAQLAPPRSRSATGAPLAFAIAASRVHSRAPSGTPLLPEGHNGEDADAAVVRATAWAAARQQEPATAVVFHDAGVRSAANAALRVPSPKLHEQPLDWDWSAAAAAMPELVAEAAAPSQGHATKEKAAAASSPARAGSQRTLSAAGTLLPTYAPLPPPLPPAYREQENSTATTPPPPAPPSDTA